MSTRPEGSIQTFSGLYVQPLAMTPEMIRLEDIAHALSNITRYAGHCSEFYSVGEHSVRVAMLLEDEGHTTDVCLRALMHDAAETYLVDLPSPVKHHPAMAFYRAAEAAAMEAVHSAFGIVGPDPACVKEADLTLLLTERRDLLPADAEVSDAEWSWHENPPLPLEHPLVPMAPARVEDLFLSAALGLIYQRASETREEA